MSEFLDINYGIKDKAGMAHLFGILRSQLYSDKISAVIREYACNAWDAHVSIGNQKTPFQVTLPSYGNPIFKIRDFGPGLSPEDVISVYSNYGESTKRKDSAQTGTLGLGSKSAFCYVNNWNITSYHNGTKYTFVSYLDDTKLGKLSELKREFTNEPNGVCIEFKTNPNDYTNFQSKGIDILKNFPVKPKCNIVIPDLYSKEFLFSIENDFHIENKFSYSSNEVYAMMGNVRYPINKDLLKNIHSFDLNLFKYKTFLFFNNGELDFSASREHLEYTEKTTTRIKNKISSVLNSVQKEVLEKFSKCKNKFEVRVMYSTMNTYRDILGNNLKLEFNGQEITPYISLKEIKDVTFKAITLKRESYSYNAEVSYLNVDRSLYLLINDIPNKNRLPSYIRGAFQFIRNKQVNYPNMILVSDTNNGENIKSLLESDEFVGVPVIKLSEINPIVNSETSVLSAEAKARSKQKVFKYTGQVRTSSASGRWTNVEVDEEPTTEDPKVFMYINSYVASAEKETWLCNYNHHTLHSIIETIFKVIGNVPIYGIKHSSEAPKSWIPLKTYLEKKINEITDTEKQLLSVNSSYLDKLQEDFQLISKFFPYDSKDYKEYKEILNTYSDKDTRSRIKTLETLFSYNIVTKPVITQKSISDMKNSLLVSLNPYPLIHDIVSYYYSNNSGYYSTPQRLLTSLSASDIQNYFKLIDESRASK